MTETWNARSEILARIRSIIAHDISIASAPEAWRTIPRDYRQAGTLSASQCTDLLCENLRDYGAGVYRSEPSEVAGTLAAILRHRKKEKMLSSPDIDPTWLPQVDGCNFVSDNLLSYADIDACDGVMTGCTVAIASTGTLALRHGPGAGRRALTLIPDYHLCVVQACNIVETVPEAMLVLEGYKNQPITLISGPSATADIEMTRIQGVHGPRVLDVAIVV